MFTVYHNSKDDVKLVEYNIVNKPGVTFNEHGNCLIEEVTTGFVYTGNSERLSETKLEAIEKAIDTQQEYYQSAVRRMEEQKAILNQLKEMWINERKSES